MDDFMTATGQTVMNQRQWDFFLKLAEDWSVTILVLSRNHYIEFEMHGPIACVRYLQGVLVGWWMGQLDQ